MQSRLVVALMLLPACGITPSVSVDAPSDIEAAAVAAAALDTYGFAWSATYELDDPPPGSPSQIVVSGVGATDARSGDVDSVVTYDETLRPEAEAAFPARRIDIIEASTRIVDGEVFLRGLNATFIETEEMVDYDVWYRVDDRRGDIRDPFVSSDVRPAEVFPVLTEPLDDAGSLSVTVERDAVLDVGTRFGGSIYDFGLRLGGDDFVVSATIEEGIMRSVRLVGDDPGSGVERFVFEMRIDPDVGFSQTRPSEFTVFP